MHTTFWSVNLNRRDPLEDIGENRMIILKFNLKELGVDWVHVIQDRVWWGNIVNSALNLKKWRGNCSVRGLLISSQRLDDGVSSEL